VEWDPSVVALSRIARTLDSLGYAPHPFRGLRLDEMRRREDRAALARIGVAGAVTANVMLASLALYSGWWSGMEASFARYFRWVSLALTAVAVAGPGRVFFTSAWAALRTRTLHMDLPIAIAIGAGFARGAANTVTDVGPIYFDGVAMLVFLLLCGRYLQQRGQRATSNAAELLYSLTPASARLVTGDGVRDVPAAAVVPGHVLEVRSGDTLAADGIVDAGASTVNVALLTGESKPVGVGPGDVVYAGTLNVASPLRVRVTQAGEASRVARLVRQVEESARNRAPVVLLADRLAGWFTGAVLVLAGLAFAFWVRRDPDQAMDNAIALLVVTCPCALALATPLAVSAAIGRAARAGILVKGPQALEVLARPGTMFLDKTGTLTLGEISLVSWDSEDWVKPLVLALERESTHPIGVAVRSAFAGTAAGKPEWSRHVVGGGIEGLVDGHHVVVGSPRFVACHPEARSDGGSSPAPQRDVDALTPVWVAVDGRLVAKAGFGDPIRSHSLQALHRLRAQGWRLAILSGDDRRVARSVGAALGFAADECHGELSPEWKCDAVKRERARANVVMVGDGVNDAAAIAAASVGVGVHGGAEASLATADVYLTRPGLSSLVQLTEGSRRTMTIIRRGIAFSLGYNVIGATLAITGAINPLLAAVLMPASSLTVLLAAWRGRSFEGPPA
jgi:Cu2+-exporting ATPase